MNAAILRNCSLVLFVNVLSTSRRPYASPTVCLLFSMMLHYILIHSAYYTAHSSRLVKPTLLAAKQAAEPCSATNYRSVFWLFHFQPTIRAQWSVYFLLCIIDLMSSVVWLKIHKTNSTQPSVQPFRYSNIHWVIQSV